MGFNSAFKGLTQGVHVHCFSSLQFYPLNWIFLARSKGLYCLFCVVRCDLQVFLGNGKNLSWHNCFLFQDFVLNLTGWKEETKEIFIQAYLPANRGYKPEFSRDSVHPWCQFSCPPHSVHPWCQFSCPPRSFHLLNLWSYFHEKRH